MKAALLAALFLLPAVAAGLPMGSVDGPVPSGDLAATFRPHAHGHTSPDAVMPDGQTSFAPTSGGARQAAHSHHGPSSPDPLARAGLFPTPEQPVRLQAFDGPASTGHFAGDYQLTFRCPTDVQVDDQTIAARGCPAYVLDPEDVMSQPVLVVDPRESLYISFNALHGGPGIRTQLQQETPSGHSRDNVIHQPHTTFMSTDGGSLWFDHRYYAPKALSSSYDEVFGEDNAMTRDHRGHLHLGSVYAVRDGSRTEHLVALYKLDRASDAPDYETNYIVKRAEPGRAIQGISMDYLSGGKTVFAAWLEAPVGGQGNVTILRQEIDARTTAWRPQDAAERITGCTGISNAVAVAGDVWIGCFAGEGFDPEPHIRRHLGDPEAPIEVPEWEVGQLQMFRIDAEDWTSHYVGPTPFNDAVNAVLGSAENVRKGAMFLAGAGAQDGRSIAVVSFGIHGIKWTPLRDYAPILTGASIGEGAARTVVDARVTAAAVTANSAVLHFLFSERYSRSDNGQGGASDREFYKAYGAVHSTGTFLGHEAFNMGAAPGSPNPRTAGLGTDLYMDRHDSIVMHRTQSGHERIFVAFGDMGFVRFGEVLEENPPLPVWVPQVPPQIIAAPVAAGNAALSAAAAGVLSLSIVARMLAVKKKTAAEAPSL